MKKYIAITAIALCALILTVKALNTNKTTTPVMTCECCKNCTDDRCKQLCSTWSNMTVAEQQSPEGQSVKEECLAICKEKKCCAPDGTCPMMEGTEDCCKKK